MGLKGPTPDTLRLLHAGVAYPVGCDLYIAVTYSSLYILQLTY